MTTENRNAAVLQQIRFSMAHHNLSATQLAKRIGISQPTMCRILDGKTRLSLDHLDALESTGLLRVTVAVKPDHRKLPDIVDG